MGKILRHCPCCSEGTACRHYSEGFIDTNRTRANDVPIGMNPWSCHYRQLNDKGNIHKYVSHRCKRSAEEVATEDEGDVDYTIEPPSRSESRRHEEEAGDRSRSEAGARSKTIDISRSKDRAGTRARSREFMREELEQVGREQERVRNITKKNWGPSMQALADEEEGIRRAEHKKRSDAAKKGWSKRKQRDDAGKIPDWLKW